MSQTLPTLRVPRGVPTGGRYAAHHRAEPVLALAPATERESTALAVEIERLPRRRSTPEGRSLAEDFRCAYPAYSGDTDADEEACVLGARHAMLEHLSGLAPERAAHWERLVSFAVEVEMRHWNDPELAASAEGYEMIVDPDDYRDPQDATEANRGRWSALADLAATHALAEAAQAWPALPKAA